MRRAAEGGLMALGLDASLAGTFMVRHQHCPACRAIVSRMGARGGALRHEGGARGREGA
jgi:hypothetical protein